MKKFKKVLAIVTALTMMLGASVSLPAKEECNCECEGPCGYADCCNAFSISPIMAFGAIALIAAVAITVQNSNNDCCKTQAVVVTSADG